MRHESTFIPKQDRKPKIYAMVSLEGSMLSLISLDLNTIIFQIWRALEDCGLAQ